MPSRRFAFQVILSFVALYTIWGSTYFAMQVAVREVPPFLMAGTRFLVAGSILLAWCRWSGTTQPGDFTPRNWRAATTVAIGLMLIGNGGTAYAMQRIPTGIGAVIVAATPMWLVLFDWAQRRNGRPSTPVFLGLALGIAGIAALKLSGRTGDAPIDLTGIVVTIIATLGWAAGSIWSRTAPRAASALTACGMQMLMGGVLLTVASVLFEDLGAIEVSAITPRFWAAWAYLVVFGSLCGFTAYIWLLHHVSAAKVGTYAYVNPVIALIIGAALNNERFTSTQMLACALILGGVIVITVFRTRAAAPRPKPASEGAAGSVAVRK